MKSILLVAITAQLPFVATSQYPFPGPLIPPDISSPSQTQVPLRTREEALRELEATTVSVMRRAEATNDAAVADRANAYGAVGADADRVVQASFNQTQPSAADRKAKTGASSGSDKSASSPSVSGQKSAQTAQPKSAEAAQPSDAAPKAQPFGANGAAGGGDATKGTGLSTKAGDSASKTGFGAVRSNPPIAAPPATVDENVDSGQDAAKAIEDETTHRSDSPAARSGDDASIKAAAAASAALLTSTLAQPRDDTLLGAGVALEGRPVSLADALARGFSHTQRLEIASLYWKLALATADYHWAVEESRQLDALPAGEGAVDSPLLATARAAAQAKLVEAKATAVTVQQELADALGQPTQPPPLTIEQPIVGAYRTHFETIFANRAAPGRTRAIDKGLPLWREAIELRTAAVQAAASGVQTSEEAYGRGTARVETLLFAHRELAAQRRAFLNAIREYNAEIVEYASHVATPSTSTATIMSMLTRVKSDSVSASGGRSTFAGSNEPTIADPTLDPAVRPAGAEEAQDDAAWRKAEGGDSAPRLDPETSLRTIDQPE